MNQEERSKRSRQQALASSTFRENFEQLRSAARDMVRDYREYVREIARVLRHGMLRNGQPRLS